MKLGLGTVQFGLDYGISNRQGRTGEAEVGRILRSAAGHGIETVDTAALYGASEAVLGRAMPSGAAFKVVTKTPGFGGSVSAVSASELSKSFASSLRRLRLPAVYGLLVHHAEDLLCESGAFLMDQMMRLQQDGLVQKVGVSVYHGHQIERIMERYRIDLIQLPVNVLDQRPLAQGHLRALKQAGVEVHARSAFLQGVLLMPPESLPPYFHPLKKHLAQYHLCLRENSLSPLQGALGFLMGIDDIDTVIVGVASRFQLDELAGCAAPVVGMPYHRFACSDEAMLNPSAWRL